MTASERRESEPTRIRASPLSMGLWQKVQPSPHEIDGYAYARSPNRARLATLAETRPRTEARSPIRQLVLTQRRLRTCLRSRAAGARAMQGWCRCCDSGRGRDYLPVLRLTGARRAMARIGGGQTASAESTRRSRRPFVLVAISALVVSLVGLSVAGIDRRGSGAHPVGEMASRLCALRPPYRARSCSASRLPPSFRTLASRDGVAPTGLPPSPQCSRR